MEKKKNIINYAITGALFLLFVIFTVIVKTADVKAIGPENSSVGLSSLNQTVFQLTGVNNTWYKVTDVLGYIAIAVAVIFAILGCVQALKRKSVRKVDYQILLLGAFYVIVVAFYLLFEIVKVNYRPTLIDGELEASYPSSHTMLTICIFATAIMQFHYLIKQKPLVIALDALSVVMMAITIIGRILSGVHWISDIIGGILLSAALVMLYYSAVDNCKYLREKRLQNQQQNIETQYGS